MNMKRSTTLRMAKQQVLKYLKIMNSLELGLFGVGRGTFVEDG